MESPATAPATTRSLFDALARELAKDGVFVGMSYGHRALKAPDKRKGSLGFACLDDDCVAFRLPVDSPEYAEAISVPGAHTFTPSSLGATLEDWVAVPADTVLRWPGWARAALRASSS